MNKTGLILEGGAMRGMFTAGVTDVMMEHGITFDGMIGVSAGAAFGCNYKSQQIGRIIRYNMRFCREPRFCSLRSLIRTGDLYGAEFCYRELPHTLDVFDTETYRKNPMRFYAVCTDVRTAGAVYHECRTGNDEDLDWMRASASMPVASRPVALAGLELLDGGIADPIPVRFFERLGYTRNVIVLTQPADYRKRKQSHMALLRLLLRKYPKIADRLAVRHVDYNRTLRYVRDLEEAGRAFVVRPDGALQIGSVEHDPSELKRVYEEGRRVALREVDAMQAFLQK